MQHSPIVSIRHERADGASADPATRTAAAPVSVRGSESRSSTRQSGTWVGVEVDGALGISEQIEI
jgi:hypothetical protein